MNPVATPVPSAAGAPALAPKKRRPTIFVGMALLALMLGIGATWSYTHRGQSSQEITVHVQDAYGLKVDAEVRYRGVCIGRVTEVRIPPDLSGVDLRLRLHTAADLMARTGTQFYIMRPTVTLANGIRGIETAIGDVYVDVTREPGTPGEPTTQFTGNEDPPIPAPAPGSREVKLSAKRNFQALRPGVQVICCGLAIGRVRTADLSEDGKKLNAVLVIDPKYIGWMNRNPKFVVLAPFRIEGSLLSNPKFHFDPASVLGGIEMLVNEGSGQKKDGEAYELE